MALSMNSSPAVVPGEAPESDDEIEDGNIPGIGFPSPRRVVSGEAPESSSSSSDFHDDSHTSKSVSERVKSGSQGAGPASPSTDIREKVLRSVRAQRKESQPSILFTKLRENNVSLRSSIVDFVRQTAQQTNKEVSGMDQDLLRSQVTLQEAVTAYRQMSKNVRDINSLLCLSPSLNGIPKINIRTVI